MSTSRKFALTTVVLAVAAFLFAPAAPLGALVWPEPVSLDVAPTGAQEGLFMLLGAINALSFGAGVAYLVFGWGATRRLVGADRPRLALAVHLSVFWVLWNWWLHDGLHMVVGMRPGGLLAIEYAFHVTLIAAAAVLAYAVFQLAGRPRAAERGRVTV